LKITRQYNEKVISVPVQCTSVILEASLNKFRSTKCTLLQVKMALWKGKKTMRVTKFHGDNFFAGGSN